MTNKRHCSIRSRGRRAGRDLAASLACVGLAAALLGPAAQAQHRLSTGKEITNPAVVGPQQNVGSLPMNIILSPNGKFALSTDMGFRESLWSIDTTTGKGISHLDYNQVNQNGSPQSGLYYGLVASPNTDGSATVYAAQGQFNSIAIINLSAAGTLTQTGTIATKSGDFPSGLALDKRGYLYVTNNDPDTFAAPTSVAIYKSVSGTWTEIGRYTFSASFGGTPNFPLAITVLPDGSKTYVASQRDGGVYVLNTADPTTPTAASFIDTGGVKSHPLAFALKGTTLYVASAHADSILTVNTFDDSVTQTISLRPSGAKTLAGVTPTGLAFSPDNKTLFASLGDFNAVAVIQKNALQGYIPAGWYPSGVVVSPDNKHLLVANAKGFQTRYPNPSYKQFSFAGAYDLNLIEGTVSAIDISDPSKLPVATALVLRNNRITATTDTPKNALQPLSLSAGKIKHVIYIIKENRTYDQVLGDLPQGNGDPSLTLFGKNVTPNLHAIASRFVLLDNFYDCSEASGDGWPWSTQSIANEYVIKNLPYNYSGRGRNYDFEGQDNGYLTGGFPATDPDGNTLSQLFPAGLPPIPDVAEAPAGHIWDDAEAAGLSYRNYGFFQAFGVSQNGVVILPDNYPTAAGLRPADHDLKGITDFDYRRYDAAYPDSDAPSIYFSQTSDPKYLYSLTKYGKHNAQSRYAEWNTEFQEELTADPTGDSVPAFQTVRLMHDHTQGYGPGGHSPRAEVADNDYGVGQLVSAISQSPIWKNTAIFVIEDDAQDGPDHIDVHRSTCYVISPWIKKSTVDHRFYNTDSVLKTIEDLLDLPPMSEYDAIADPIGDWDHAPNNSAVYAAILPDKSIIGEHNPTLSALKPGSEAYKMAVLASKLDFIHPDSAPDKLVNEMLWKSIKGWNSKMPAPRHRMTQAALHRKGYTPPVSHTKDSDD